MLVDTSVWIDDFNGHPFTGNFMMSRSLPVNPWTR